MFAKVDRCHLPGQIKVMYSVVRASARSVRHALLFKHAAMPCAWAPEGPGHAPRHTGELGLKGAANRGQTLRCPTVLLPGKLSRHRSSQNAAGWLRVCNDSDLQSRLCPCRWPGCRGAPKPDGCLRLAAVIQKQIKAQQILKLPIAAMPKTLFLVAAHRAVVRRPYPRLTTDTAIKRKEMITYHVFDP